MLMRITPPASPVVSLQEIKAHLRLDHAIEDEYLMMLVASATEWVEQVTGRALITQVWQKKAMLCEGVLALDYAPVQEILGVRSEREEIRRFTLDCTGAPCIKVPGRDGTLDVIYRCGYGDRPVTVPAPLRHVVMLVAGHYYEKRDLGLPPEHAKLRHFLQPYRIMRIK